MVSPDRNSGRVLIQDEGGAVPETFKAMRIKPALSVFFGRGAVV
jgi:hypothetical protein